MKKLAAVLLAFLIMLSAVGCSPKAEPDVSPPPADASAPPDVQPDTSPVPEISEPPETVTEASDGKDAVTQSPEEEVGGEKTASEQNTGKNNEKDTEKPGKTEGTSQTKPTEKPAEKPSSGLRSKPVTNGAAKSGAEATIATLYANLAAGMTWGEVWDKYVYSGSKTLGYTRGSFITEKEDFQNTYGIKYKGIEILSSEERKPGVFLVNGILSYNSNGETVTENGSDYVVYENGEYYISLSGSLLEAAFAKCISTFPNISCLDAAVYEYDDRTVIECTLYNLSDIDYYVGAANGLPITVWQNGSSISSAIAPGIIRSDGYFALTVELKGYSGMPDKITLEKIIELTNAETGEGIIYPMDIMLYYS